MVSRSKLDTAASTDAMSSPTGVATTNPAFDAGSSTPGVARACRPRTPAAATNESPTSTSRASPRRRAASADTKPRARLMRPVTRTSQKWEGWCSQRPSTSGQPSRTRRPRSGAARSAATRSTTEIYGRRATIRSGSAGTAVAAHDGPVSQVPTPPRTPPDVYTHGHHEAVLRSHQWRTAANSAAYLLPHLASGMFLLDIGCGPGTITIDLAEAVAPGRVVGLDVVREPLEA